jgi:hypothetical protein
MVIMVTEGKPCPHLGTILFVLMAAVAVFGIEVGNDALEEEEPAFRV